MKYFSSYINTVKNAFDEDVSNILKTTLHFFNKNIDNFEFQTTLDYLGYINSLCEEKCHVKEIENLSENPFKDFKYIWKWPKYFSCYNQTEPFCYFDNDIILYSLDPINSKSEDFIFFSEYFNYSINPSLLKSQYLNSFSKGISVLKSINALPPSLKDVNFEIPNYRIYNSSLFLCRNVSVYSQYIKEMTDSLKIFTENKFKIFESNPDSNFINSILISVSEIYDSLLLSKIVQDSGLSISSLYPNYNNAVGLPNDKKNVYISHMGFLKNDPSFLKDLSKMNDIISKNQVSVNNQRDFSSNFSVPPVKKSEISTSENVLKPSDLESFFTGNNLDIFQDGQNLYQSYLKEINNPSGCSACAKNRIKRKYASLIKLK